MKKKFILVLCFFCFLLSGCGADPITAEDLLANAYGSESVSSIDADVAMDMDISLDLSIIYNSITSIFLPDDNSLTENEYKQNSDNEEIEEPSNEDFVVSFDFSDSKSDVDEEENTEEKLEDIPLDIFFKVKTGVNYKKNESAYSIDGSNKVFVEIPSLEESDEESKLTRIYGDLPNNLKYTYDDSNGVWYKEEDTEGTVKFVETVVFIAPEMLESFELKEYDKRDSYYKISGKLTEESVNNLLLNVSSTEPDDNLLFSIEDIKELFFEAEEPITVDVTMLFDKETKQIKSIEYVASPYSMGMFGVEINSVSILVEINDINNTKVFVPHEVLEKAEEKQEDPFGWAWSDDFWEVTEEEIVDEEVQ